MLNAQNAGCAVAPGRANKKSACCGFNSLLAGDHPFHLCDAHMTAANLGTADQGIFVDQSWSKAGMLLQKASECLKLMVLHEFVRLHSSPYHRIRKRDPVAFDPGLKASQTPRSWRHNAPDSVWPQCSAGDETIISV